MRVQEIQDFLTYLAVNRQVAASTQNQVSRVFAPTIEE